MTTITRMLLLATSLFFTTFLFGQTRYYVNAAATGGNDGSSWGDAFADLQDALAAAQYGDEVWVGAGTYYPTTTTDRTISFVLKNGVKLYGGFAGTEALLNERDWAVNETILSGDIGVPGDSTDNSYNVVYGQDVTFTCSINGFIIERGMADNQDPLEPSFGRKKSGGGIHLLSNVISTYPNIENCVFRNNIAAYAGGAMLLRANSNKNINPKVAFCKFINNHSYDSGGAIYLVGGSFQSTLLFGFNHCEFEANIADQFGSAIYFFDSFGSVPLSILDCNFNNNESHNGTISYRDFNNSQESIHIYDCDFNNNISAQGSCFFAQNATFQTVGIVFSTCNFEKNIGRCLHFDVGPTAEDGLIIDNCTFSENTLASSTFFYSGSNGSIKLSNSQFKKNNASSSLINAGILLKIENSVFEKNSSTGNSGGMLIMNNGIIKNSLFSSNNSKLDGDAIYSTGNVQIYNSTFVENTAAIDSSNMFRLNNAHFENVIIVKNNPFFPNKLFKLQNANSNVTVQNSLLSSPDCNSLPIACGPGNLFGLDPMFADTAAGDFTLLPSSPAINAGDNAIVDSFGIATDLAGNTRIRGGTVDMGAYESTAGNIIYVNLNVQGGNQDGTSWTDAFSDLQDALAVAAYGDEIWVAQGTYFPTATTDREIPFVMKNGIKLFGGFTGVEIALYQRDWQVNETILSGDIGVVGDSTDNSYTILYVGTSDVATLIDGLVFVHGTANGTAGFSYNPTKSGGAIYISDENSYAYPRIWNCRFEHNFAASYGGAVYVLGSLNGSVAPQFKNCNFKMNHAGLDGGAIRRDGGSWVDVKYDFWDCTFERNSADRDGGGVYYTESERSDTIEFVGCDFVENYSQGQGGGISYHNGRDSGSKLLIKGGSFVKNYAYWQGGGIYIDGSYFLFFSYLLIEKVDFKENICSEGEGGGLYVDAFSIEDSEIFPLTILNCTFESNISQSGHGLLIADGYEEIKVTKCIFKSNSKTSDNGFSPTLVTGDFTTIDDCIFTNNGNGNGPLIQQLSSSKYVKIQNSLLVNNGPILRTRTVNKVDTISNCVLYHKMETFPDYSIEGSVFVTNSIFVKETDGGNLFPIPAENVTVEHCMFASPDCTALPSYVTCGPGNIFGLDPLFADTAAGDFHLLAASPGINAGNNDIVNELGIVTDIEGNPRLQGGTVDMGAYESAFNGNNSGVKYVNINVQGGNNNGTSWANAYLDLQDALSASQYGDEVWVAQGTYHPTPTTDRNIYFELKNGVKLYGGFAGVEAQLNERDWVANETLLSGDIGVLGDSTDNSYTILYLSTSDTTTIIDGLVFRRGIADKSGNGSQPSGSGGAIFVRTQDTYAYPRIHNCKFENNYARYYGGAVSARGNNGFPGLQFYNCEFNANHAGRNGGAIAQMNAGLIEVKNNFWNCTFNENSTKGSDGGGGIHFFSSFSSPDTIEFIGCTFNANRAVMGNGGGLSFNGTDIGDIGNIIVISECDFVGNNAESGGGFSLGSNPTSLTIKKTTFSSNYTNYSIFSGSAAAAIYYTSHVDTFDLNILDCYFTSNNSDYPILSIGSSTNEYIGNTILKGNIFDSNSDGIMITRYGLNRIDDCIFKNNGTSIASPFLVADAKTTIVTNSVFANNKGDMFSHAYYEAFDTIANCTFYNNITAIPYDTVLKEDIFFTNCIFNQVMEENAFPFLASNITLENSLILSPDCSALPSFVTCGPGNLFGLEPLFADTATGDFHLLPTSPGINAGNNAIINALDIATDIEGNLRIVACNVDMGAYEALDYEVVVLASTPQSTCSGQPGGAVQFQLMNGCVPYSYAWTNGASTGTGNTGLFPGTYAFTITDALGKTVEAQVTIPVVPAVDATTIILPYNCTAGTSGSVSVTTTGGASPFAYLWSNGATDATLAGLLPGTYTVTVTDANGCVLSDTVAVGMEGSISLGITISPITCHDSADGIATLQPIGGTPPFAWHWLSGEDIPTVDSLAGGTYSATVTDALGCTGDLSFTMNAPLELVASIAAMQPTCAGLDGMAMASATGGTPGYHFLWDNGAATASTDLTAGSHTVTVTDEHGCTDTANTVITEPTQLVVAISAQPPVLCFGDSNGVITVMPMGGTAPYSSAWGSTIEHLPAGNYAVTITDSNGCTAVGVASIPEYPEITVASAVTHASTPTTADGGITLTNVQGGTGSGYTFLWSDSSTGQDLLDVPPGDYTLTITDGDGCTAVFPFFVDFETAAGEARDNTFGAAIVPNPSGKAGARLVLEKQLPGLTVRVLDALGRLIVYDNMTAFEYLLPKGLAAGMYWLLLDDGSNRVALKWVVVQE